jgi:hypothetical protein
VATEALLKAPIASRDRGFRLSSVDATAERLVAEPAPRGRLRASGGLVMRDRFLILRNGGAERADRGSMTQPTFSARSTVFDALLTDPGPTYQDVKESQRPPNDAARVLGGIAKQVSAAAFDLVKDYRLAGFFADKGVAALARYTGATSAEKAALGAAASSLLLYAEAGVRGTEIAYDLAVGEPMRRGAALNAALVRDNQNLALLFVVNRYASDAVPVGLLEAEKSRVLGTTDAHYGTVAMDRAVDAAIAVDAGDPGAVAARDVMVAAFRDGTTSVYQRAIRDPRGLADALGRDKELKTRYDTDPAFRQGIRAAVWQAQNDPRGFDVAASLNAPLRGTRTRM